VVLLTDGEDTTSRTDWRVAERYAHTMRIPIFSIGLGVGKLAYSSRKVLKGLAAETGLRSHRRAPAIAVPSVVSLAIEERAGGFPHNRSHGRPSRRGRQDHRRLLPRQMTSERSTLKRQEKGKRDRGEKATARPPLFSFSPFLPCFCRNVLSFQRFRT
jgi:hypothetical protein